MKLTDFDYLIGDHHLQMIKAALPYVNVAEQRFLSIFVKIKELQRTISLFREDQVAAMGICSLGEGQKSTPLEMMKAIRPYGNTQEQDFIDIVCNFLQGPRLGGQYPDIVAAQDSLTPDAPPTDIISHDGSTEEAGGYNGRPFGSASQDHGRAPSGPYAFHSQPEEDQPESLSSSTASGEAASSEAGAYDNTPLSAASIHPARSPLEQLKGFLPPDQQARLEQAAFLLQAMQQFT